jgi:D-alanyl-D-alanine carboxypeptidase
VVEEQLSRVAHRARRRRRRARTLTTLIAVVVIVGAVAATAVALTWPNTSTPSAESESPMPSQTPSETPSPTPTPTPTFDKTAHSIDDPSSPWVVVNKLRPVTPSDYAAPDLVDVPVPHANPVILRQAASDAVVAMFAAYTAETGLQMQSQSAYRSYATQQRVYGGNDTLTARPGFSEHQTGLAIDISSLPAVCALQICFADTPQGQWLAGNAYKWGFVLRYPDGKTPVTGYQFEPWHYRWVGVELATEMHDTGVATLEEFFGLPPAPNYP